MRWQRIRQKCRAEAQAIIIGINEINDIPSGILPVNCDTLIEMLDMLIVIGKAVGATVLTEASPRL